MQSPSNTVIRPLLKRPSCRKRMENSFARRQVPGFIDFHEIMMNPNSQEYEGMKEWSGYWTIELSDWEKRPRVIWC